MASKAQKEERIKKIKFWQPHITAWQSSGLTVAGYCRSHQLSVEQLARKK